MFCKRMKFCHLHKELLHAKERCGNIYFPNKLRNDVVIRTRCEFFPFSHLRHANSFFTGHKPPNASKSHFDLSTSANYFVFLSRKYNAKQTTVSPEQNFTMSVSHNSGYSSSSNDYRSKTINDLEPLILILSFPFAI